MFNNSRTHQDEYIREYAFEPELLINREDYLREEERARKLPSTPVRLRWDEAIAKQKEQQRRTASQSENASDDKNQIEFEIEAFYYVSRRETRDPRTRLSPPAFLHHHHLVTLRPAPWPLRQTFAKTSGKLAMCSWYLSFLSCFSWHFLLRFSAHSHFTFIYIQI